MDCYTREQIEEAMKSKGYKYFTGGGKDYDVNIIGVRNSKTKGRVTNAFDDCITVSFIENGEWQFYCFPATTDPGSHWEQNLLNEKGVAILKPGQYRGSHKLRLHQGKYLALGQKAPVKVYRDKNKDGKYDLNEESIDEGLFGINIHRATGRSGGKSIRVDKWSAGCQVIADNDDWHCFLDICQSAREIWGNSFTYTLLESKDIVG
tara:strand:+ start:1492 stop:2109 length:618 start_codon:yes stop_codon:yes gene_type:complete